MKLQTDPSSKVAPQVSLTHYQKLRFTVSSQADGFTDELQIL